MTVGAAPAASSADAGPLLAVSCLDVEFPTRHGTLRAVHDVSFEIGPGEILGVVGESGAGKSLTGAAVIGLIDAPGRIAGGEIRLAGRRIDNLPYETLRAIRGREIGAIFQDPLTSLNPLYTIGAQLVETIQTHLPLGPAAARARAIALLDEVGISAAARRFGHYPHQFSGGMRQRVVIALALAARPRLVIADEPTTALDVSIQAQIIELLKRLCREHGTAVMLITHDMGVIAEAADRVAVMYAGRIVEIGPGRGRHPPSGASLHRRSHGIDPFDRRRGRPPRPDRRRDAAPRRRTRRLRVPSAMQARDRALPAGSAGAAACRRDGARRCWLALGWLRGKRLMTAALLTLTDVARTFDVSPPWLDRVLERKPRALLKAVDGVSLAIAPGETLGLVGESGCGKSTVARLIVGLYAPTRGTIEFDGVVLAGDGRRRRLPRSARRGAGCR